MLPLWNPTASLLLDLWPPKAQSGVETGCRRAESRHQPSFVTLWWRQSKCCIFFNIRYWYFNNSKHTILCLTQLLVKTHRFSTKKTNTINSFTYLRNLWKAKSVSWMGSQAGSRKNCFSTSVSRLRLVGGSPWGSCRKENNRLEMLDLSHWSVLKMRQEDKILKW